MYLFVQTQFLPFIQSVLIVPHVKPPSWHWVGIMLPARLIGRYHPGCSILSQIVPLTPVFFTDRCHWSRVLQLTSKHGSSTDCENIVTLHANKQLVYDLDAYVHLYMNENMTPYPSRTPLIYMNENLSCMGFETRLISQMPLVKKELSLPEHLSSPSVFCVVRAAEYLVYWAVVCFFPFDPFFLLHIVLSVLPQFPSDYHFSILKFFSTSI